MIEITRGTTPTVIFSFDDVRTSDITAAYMTIRQESNQAVVVKREIEDAVIDEGTVSFKLTQSDTLAVEGKAEILLNWKTADSTRGVSKKIRAEFKKNHIDKVI